MTTKSRWKVVLIDTVKGLLLALVATTALFWVRSFVVDGASAWGDLFSFLGRNWFVAILIAFLIALYAHRKTHLPQGGMSSLTFLLFIILMSGCTPQLSPQPGMKDAVAGSEGVIVLRDCAVDLAAGSSVCTSVDMSIETRAETQLITRTLNSATTNPAWLWQWNFQMNYRNGVFRDDIGTVYDIATLPIGPIHGSVWKKASASVIEGRGNIRYIFDPATGILMRVERANHPWIETRVSGGRITQMVECTSSTSCENVFTMEYNAQGRLASITDRIGRRAEYEYNSYGELTQARNVFETEMNLPGHVYQYSSMTLSGATPWKQVLVENSEHERVTYRFAENGRILESAQLGLGNPTTLFEYAYTSVSSNPHTTTVIDPEGYRTRYSFGKNGKIGSRTLSTQEVETWQWTGERITEYTSAAGVRTRYTWNAADELSILQAVSSVGTVGRTFTITYPVGVAGVNPNDPFAVVPATISDSDGTIITNTFDGVGHILTTTNGAGDIVTTTYGVQGVIQNIQYADGVVLAFSEFNAQGLPIEVAVGNSTERRQFDTVGNMEVGTEKGSRTATQWPGIVRRKYNAARLVSQLWMSQSDTVPASSNTVIQDVVLTYRSNGDPLATHRPFGAHSIRSYDSLGNMVEHRECVSLPAGSVLVGSYNANDLNCPGGMSQSTRFEYTMRGELSRKVRSNGMEQRYAYDGAGRVVKITNLRNGAFESEVVYTFENGRLVCAIDTKRPNATCRTYDVFGRVAEITWPDREKTRYQYTSRDHVETTTYVNAQGNIVFGTVASYDAAGREVEVRRALDGSLLMRKTYVQGRVTTILEGNGLERTINYDTLGKDVGFMTKNSAGTTVETETFTYNSSYLFHGLEHKVVYWAQTISGERRTFERYGGVAWMNGERYFTPTPMPDSSAAGYTMEDVAVPFWTSYIIQANTTIHADYFPASGGGYHSRIYKQNAEGNRLLSIAYRSGDYFNENAPENTEHTYTWDSAGFAKSKDGIAFTWDATGCLTSFNGATRVCDAEGNLTRTTENGQTSYVRWGGVGSANASGVPQSIDLKWAKASLSTPGAVLYRHVDYRGNVKSTSDENGNILSVNAYSTYRRERTEGNQTDPYEFAQGVRWAGVVIVGARPLDPDSGWFMAPDLIEDPVHQHAYPQDALRFWDPTGRQSESQSSTGRTVAGWVGAGLGATFGGLIGMSIATTHPVAGVAAGAFLGTIFAEAGQSFGQAAYDTIGTNPGGPKDSTASGKGRVAQEKASGVGGYSQPGGKPRPGGPRADGSPFSKRGQRQKEGDTNVISRSGAGFGGSGGGGHRSSGGGGCGLLGIEPFFVLSFFLLRRRRYAHV
jgi:YD repeat-containing protein